MDLYIATSISYLFTAICFKVNENHDVPGDLVVVDNFPHAREHVQRLKDIGLFRHVDVVGKAEFDAWGRLFLRRYNKLTGYMAMLIVLLIRRFPNLGVKKYRKHAFAKGRYDRCYSTGNMPAFRWFHLDQLKKYNCRMYYFDSGVATRCGYETPAPDEPRTFRLARRFGCLYLDDYVEGRYYFNPAGVNPVLGKPLQQILPSAENAELARAIGQVFAYDPQSDTMFQHGTLFFQQCFDTYPDFHAFVDVQRDLWKHVLAHEPDARICLHQRSKDRYDEKAVFSDSNGVAPFEVRCMFAENIEHVMLCSCYSFALFVPKLMFGQEPYLVFLYRLLHADTIIDMTMEQWDRLIDRSLRACYSDPGKIYIPRSMEELEACLDEICRHRSAASKAREGEQ